VTFATMILCIASQRVIPKVNVYFVIHSVRKLLDTPSYLRVNYNEFYEFIIETLMRITLLLFMLICVVFYAFYSKELKLWSHFLCLTHVDHVENGQDK
jgi:hypothetical protein